MACGRWFLATAVALAACGAPDGSPEADSTGEAATPLPDLVRIEDPGLHPEGIEWDEANDRFLVSSVTRGTVTEVRDDGIHAVFIEDPEIVSSIGIHIDEERGRLLVAASDVGAFQGGEGHARLGAYDLTTGERLFMVDLGAEADPEGQHFANDMTVGPDGTAYVTDSMTPVIYAVSTGGAVDVLLRDGPLAEGGFLNGIDYHPDGYLLVALAGARALLKIDLEPEPTISAVSIPEPFGADGLTLTPEGALIAVATTGDPEAPRSEVLRLTSDDGWESASIEARADAADAATTAAVREGAVYVLDARFGDMGADEPAPHFDITRVRFP